METDLDRLNGDPKTYSFERVLQAEELKSPSDYAGRMTAITVHTARGKPITFINACGDELDIIAYNLVRSPETHVELLIDLLFPPYENGPMRFTHTDPLILRRGKSQYLSE